MDKRGNDPLQEELRSSQVYKTLKGSGIPMAGKLAEGLGKAAQGLDQALNLGRGPGQAQGGHPYQAPPQQSAYRPPQNTTQTRQAPPPSGSAQPGGPNTAGPAGNGYYHYSYRKSGQAPPPPQQTPPPVYQPQTKAQRQAAANRAAAARQAAKQQAAAAKQAAKQGAAQQANAQQVGPQVPMKMVRRGSPAKFYITAAAALVYATSAPLYEPYHFVIFAAVLVLVFLGSSALFKGKKEFVPIQPEKPKEEPKKEPEKEEKSHTGNPEVDKIIDEGREYLKKLRAADDAIPDETLSEDITRMERASADIFRYIADHPEKAPQIRKFMNYYLPTTLKLLNAYDRMSSQGVEGQNISGTMERVESMMSTIVTAFERQLDSLFGDQALDISTDITVLENMMAREGLSDDPIHQTRKETPAAEERESGEDGDGIQLEL